MRQLFTTLVLLLFIYSCSNEKVSLPEKTIFQKLEGKWKLVKKETYNENADNYSEVVDPEFVGIINIVITDTVIKNIDTYDYNSNEINGFIEYFEADRYGYEAMDYYKSPIRLLTVRENTYASLDREDVFFRDFGIWTDHYYWPSHYIKEITDNKLVLTIGAFPIWPDMTYERVE